VFASSDGDGVTVDEICDSLSRAPLDLSPTRFHNSVHNVTAGYWSIATQNRAPSTAVCAFDASFSAGLLEAATLCASGESPVLLVAYDLPFPPVLNHVRPLSVPVAVALALGADLGAASMARCSVELEPDASPTVPEIEGLQAIHASPAGRALPMLALLARGRTGTARLEYLDSCSLAVHIHPL
jgi:hypothetical protein